MTKQEFLRRLHLLLADMTEEERQEALRYYEECFDEAGPEGEQDLIAELGSPEKVAAIIKANVPGGRVPAPQPQPASGPSMPPPEPAPRPRDKNWVWVLVVILILLAPALLGLAGGLIGLVAGLAGAVIGVFAGGVAAAIVGIVAIVRGVLLCLGGQFGTALILMGMGFLDMAVGLGLLALGCWAAFWLIPAIWHGIKQSILWICNKVKGA